MPWGAVAAAGISLIGSQMQADSAEDAVSAQKESSAAAIGEQRRQFDVNRSDLAPWRNTGRSALNRIALGLGLSSSSLDPASAPVMPSRTSFIRMPAAGRVFMGMDENGNPTFSPEPPVHSGGASIIDGTTGKVIMGGGAAPAAGEMFDQAGYEAAMADYQRQRAAFDAAAAGDPTAAAYGDLSRKFTLQDLEADPVYQKEFEFGLSEGQKAVNRMFGARGLSRSGAAAKAAMRFASDYAGSKSSASRQRFVEDQNNLYAKLAGVAGTGQAATTATANMGTQMASNIADIQVGTGNARGAASIAQGNAAAGGLNSIANNISGQFTLDRMINRGGNYGGVSSNIPLVQPSVPGQFNIDTYG